MVSVSYKKEENNFQPLERDREIISTSLLAFCSFSFSFPFNYPVFTNVLVKENCCLRGLNNFGAHYSFIERVNILIFPVITILNI